MAAVTPNVTYLSDGSCEVSAEGAGLGQFMTPQECAAAAASNEACYAAKLGSTSTFVWSAEGECSCCESPPFLGTYISAVYAMEWDNGNPTPTTPDETSSPPPPPPSGGYEAGGSSGDWCQHVRVLAERVASAGEDGASAYC